MLTEPSSAVGARALPATPLRVTRLRCTRLSFSLRLLWEDGEHRHGHLQDLGYAPLCGGDSPSRGWKLWECMWPLWASPAAISAAQVLSTWLWHLPCPPCSGTGPPAQVPPFLLLRHGPWMSDTWGPMSPKAGLGRVRGRGRAPGEFCAPCPLAPHSFRGESQTPGDPAMPLR